jgi:hypothetical protein
VKFLRSHPVRAAFCWRQSDCPLVATVRLQARVDSPGRRAPARQSQAWWVGVSHRLSGLGIRERNQAAFLREIFQAGPHRQVHTGGSTQAGPVGRSGPSSAGRSAQAGFVRQDSSGRIRQAGFGLGLACRGINYEGGAAGRGLRWGRQPMSRWQIPDADQTPDCGTADKPDDAPASGTGRNWPARTRSATPCPWALLLSSARHQYPQAFLYLRTMGEGNVWPFGGAVVVWLVQASPANLQSAVIHTIHRTPLGGELLLRERSRQTSLSGPTACATCQMDPGKMASGPTFS